jgi:hypothetical protein
MNALDISALLAKYDAGDLTTKELLGEAFSYLSSHPGDVSLVLTPLREHADRSIQELEGKLLTLLGRARTTPTRGERVG